MARLAATVLVSMALAGLPAHAFAQTRDARAPSRPTAALTGTVVSDEAEPHPVRHVRVTCSGTDYAATAISDDRGRFSFAGLRGGRYLVTATKDAWVTTAYGAKRPLRPGSAIPIADGQAIDIVLRMLRGSVITGVLLDHDNQPAANTMVSALRYAMQNGTRRLVPAGAARTDDRGVYRIYGLPPADFVISATANPGQFNDPTSELRLIDARTRSERTVAFAPTYFPGTTTGAQAVAVSLRPAEERDGIDFSLQLVPTARVEGMVTTVDGQPAAAGTEINLIASAQSDPGNPSGAMRSTRIGADGGFRFTDVAPGAYTVLARSGTPLTWATAGILVEGEAVTGLSLALQPAMSLAGRIQFEGSRLKPASFQAVGVTLQPLPADNAIGLAPSTAVIDGDGHFEIGGVIPGRYQLVASLPGLGRAGQWQVRSSLVRGVDTSDLAVEIRPGESIRDALVVFTDRAAALTGAVHTAAGGAPDDFTVVLFPAEPQFWGPQGRRMQAVRPAADGAFAFHGLPPGDYYVAVVDDVERGEWFDPAFLQRLLPSALRIAIAEGEQKIQDIRLGGHS